MTDRRHAAAYALLVVAAGLNLRDPITSIASTLGAVTRTFALTTLEAAVLSSLPVFMLALGAPVAPALERRFGVHRTLVGLSLVLALSVAFRPVGVAALFAGTIVVGLAISGLSVLVPQLIRDRFPGSAGLWSGIFSTSFGVSAAVGAGLTVPVVAATGSLRWGLALWAVPAALLVVVAAAVARRSPTRPTADVESAASPSRHWRTPLLYRVTAFFAAQALVFFAVTAWLSTVYTDRGASPEHAAGLLALASVAGLPGSLTASMLAARLQRQHWIVVAVSAGTVTGLAGVVWAPVALAPIAVAALGFAQGATFGLAITLIVLKADPSAPLAPFSAFAQGVGFAVAGLGPMLLGVIRSAGLPWSYGAILLIGVVVVQAAAGASAGRTAVTVLQTDERLDPVEQHS